MKSSMPFPPNPESSVEELKRLHLHCNVWLNAIKVDSSAELETTSFDFPRRKYQYVYTSDESE